MTITRFSGPVFVTGQQPAIAGYTTDYNQDAGPSLVYLGVGLLDHRFAVGSAAPRPPRGLGLNALTNVEVLSAAPATAAANNIAASQTPVAGTPLTLVSTTGAGITVLATAISRQDPSGLTIPAGSLAIDGAPGEVAFGKSGQIAFYDPSKAIARAVRIVSAGDDSGATFTVRGADIYGYSQTETITGANGTATSKKAFKFVYSVTPAGTLSGSAVTVGTTDTIGLPLRVDSWPYVLIYWNGSLVTSSTGFTAADATSPATATTGSTRGTYALQSASDGTKKLVVFVSIPTANLKSGAGVFGVTPA